MKLQNLHELSASEALFGFAGWLTTREQVTKMGGEEDCAPIVDLISRFCKTNKLTEPRDNWDRLLEHPMAEEYNARKGPEIKTLKKNRKTLTDEERAEVIKKKAVRDDKAPAVWKAEVNGKTWYVTNTHRAYNVTPTLKGTISRFHKFIKSTS